MELRRIEVDHSQKESLQYIDPTFPFEIWTDDYSMFIEHTLNCHWHPEFEFGVMLSGELDYYIGGMHYRLKAGDCIFINSNTLHTATQAKGCEKAVMYIIAFSASLIVNNMDSLLYQKYFQPILGKGIQGDLISKESDAGRSIYQGLQEIYALNNQVSGYELRCLSLLCTIWNHTIIYLSQNASFELNKKSDQRNEERAKAILEYIRVHFADDLSIDQIAQSIPISRSECFRCFKRFTNKTPIEYLTEYRLAQASKMLMETQNDITHISASCGFCTSSYFCKLFRKKYGLSPAQYRKKYN